MPLFSIIIPLYNKQNYIAATLQSVLDQTFSDFEILVINDASTDNSLAVAQEFNDSRIKIINHPINKGLPASRNTGIDNAGARYLAFLDADDIWKPQYLEKIHELIINYPEASLFATKYVEIYNNSTPIELSHQVETGMLDNFFVQNSIKSIYCPSSLCIEKVVFEKVGYYKDIYFGEDIDLNIRIHLAFKMAYLNESLVRYNFHSENQITHASMAGKSRIDFDYYENAYPENLSLKKYLDFHRYSMAKRYRRSGDFKTYKELLSKIDLRNLNKKQIILLYSPPFILQFIIKLKAFFHKKGINPTAD
ncbi:glycosyltransferase family 2 protein [Flavobacterium microcysteis]|uniref:Glycosyltransferase family 2 protein n=1 Tax=Flavobacterium microcysteis TaxID=2596891 RepID=A0A501QMW1_9FLAO|nr:glycosyltransferase family A protein [Flavobacterium microcysteis]TPD73565.1 glycosyltransferase family 2 protein [Flavobacterium microcysteis]